MISRVVVVGGGIAGLAAAYYLNQKAERLSVPVSITVLERDSRWGGKILSDRLDGFVVEAGPDTFLATKPWGVALCRELGLEQRLYGTNPRLKNTYVLHRGKLCPLPDGLAMMIPTNFGSMARTRLLTWPQKVRMGLDFFLPVAPSNGDESLGAFVSRRLGRAAYENLIEPLMSGIYAGDGDHLSLQSTFPYLRDMEVEHGGLVRGALNMRRQAAVKGQKAPGSRSAFLTPATGLAEIVEALVNNLESAGAQLCLNTPVRELQASASGYTLVMEDGASIHSDALVLALPAFAAAGMLEPLDPRLAHELQGIEYVTTATVSLAYRHEDLPRPLDGYGYVIPRREGRQALACTWTSTKFPHRAPDGYALLRVFIGRAGQHHQIDWDETGLVQMAREELRLSLDILADPVLTRAYIWPQAMPQYNLGHPERLQHIEASLQRWQGLALAGNGYRGIGIPDCIHSGELAAGKVMRALELAPA